ncbi:hypothetical protein CCACVL1_07921 [Corchorus capsularis]|uniref:Uncharacterized protein n=1 Tax=Corchorus capsularis TaxID=210143 RepID=A0A1R3J3A2_COCAP|nr:hypothetical protein CCACVL1_07921 [Corchorus capsularis]
MSQTYTKWIHHGEKSDTKFPSHENEDNGSSSNCPHSNDEQMDDGTVQERYGEGPLQMNDIAAEVIESRFVERNKKSKEDTCIENLDQDINVETESESNDDEYDSDLDPTL